MDLKRNSKRSLLGVKDDCCGSTLSDGYSETASLCLRLQHAQSLLAALERLRNREQLCDVILKIAETEIKAHRVVLAAVSPYFNAMFTGDHKESRQNVIQLNGLDPSAVCLFVEFAYVAKVKITADNVQSLLTAASLLQVESLVEKCCHFLESELHPSNCLGIRRFAESHGCFALSKIAKQYAMRNFDQTTQLEEFLQCSIEGVIEILSEDVLYVRHEEEIYEAALRWLNYSKQDRLEKFPKLAEVIRFPLMAWEFLVTKVLDDGLITSNPHTLYLFEEARRYHLAPQLRHEMNQGSRLRPRKLYGQAEWIYVIGGETSPGRNTVKSVDKYNPTTDTWCEVSPMLTPRRGLGAAILDGILYVVGGSDGIAAVNQVEYYDPSLDAWAATTSMLEHRSSVGVAVLDGFLYAVGGYNGQATVKTVERYNPRMAEWQMITEMTTERSMLGAASLNGELYAVGGYDGIFDLSSVECYNSQANVWRQVSPMKTPRCLVGVAVLNSHLFAIGGCNGQSLETVEIYSPDKNTWTIIAPMKQRRSDVGTAVVDGLLYIVGGSDGMEYLNSMEVFHPQKRKWTSSTSMQTTRKRFGCCS